MRFKLLYNPRAFCERMAELSKTRRRLASLRGTAAGNLSIGQIDSLELLELVRPISPKVFYDIGANGGSWTLLAKALYPTSEIHCFEPLPAHVAKFRTATKSLPGVTLHEIALGQESKRSILRVTNFSDASSLLRLTDIGKEEWNLRQVEEVPILVSRLDEVVSQRKLPRPDLIKVDVQGFELEVLRGAEDTIANARAVLLEASFVNYYDGQCSFAQLVGWLDRAGFSVRALGQSTALGRPLVQSDVLFCRN